MRGKNQVPISSPDANLRGCLPCRLFAETIRMRGKDQVPVSVQLVPFYPGVYTCQVVFVDAAVGEFAVELVSLSVNWSPDMLVIDS
jgi:hypothetical protein